MGADPVPTDTMSILSSPVSQFKQYCGCVAIRYSRNAGLLYGVTPPSTKTKLFDESIRLAPAFARPYNYRAAIAADLGDREAALAWLQRAEQADPDSWRTHRNLGKLLADLERYPEAEMHLRKTVQLFGDDAGGRLALARVVYAQGKYDDFVKEAKAAVAFLANWNTPVPEVRDFLASSTDGVGRLAAAGSDPRIIIGWNYD
jgi:tetratricopeptide (TPR) repeat protein